MQNSNNSSFFQQQELIGQGAYSKVYKSTKFSSQSNQSTAIKVYQKSKSNSNIINHGKRERDILKNINSEYVCSYRKSIESKNRFYMVQKFEEGLALDKILQKKKKLKTNQVIKITKAILQGLQYLHQKGIMHRDLKPSNIIYHIQTNKAVILDLGFACFFHKNDERMLTTIVGTPYYMSPELLMGQKYNSLSDIWSLGVLMYELLCGQVPYQGRSQKQILNSILNDSLVFKSSPCPILEVLIRMCLKIDPKQRIHWQQLFEWKESGKLQTRRTSLSRKHKKYNSYSLINFETQVKNQVCNCAIY